MCVGFFACMLQKYRCTLSSDKTQQVVHYILIDHQKEWREKWSLKWLWSHSLRLSLRSNCIHIHYCSPVSQKTKRQSDADIIGPLTSQWHHETDTDMHNPTFSTNKTPHWSWNNNQPTDTTNPYSFRFKNTLRAQANLPYQRPYKTAHLVERYSSVDYLFHIGMNMQLHWAKNNTLIWFDGYQLTSPKAHLSQAS